MSAFLLFVYTVAAHSVAAFTIASFEETIINPSFPDHPIPVYVYYPSEHTISGPWPTIVFAHGFECPAEWYSWIYRNIVPNGYIVAYINSYTGVNLNQTQFAVDQRYTLQWLNTIVNDNRSSPLYHLIETTRAMAAGHSEGGGASILSLGSGYVDSLFKHKHQFKSVFAMAPCGQSGDTVLDAAQHVSVPTFIFSGTMDCICPEEESKRIYDAIPSSTCKYLSDVTNGTHCNWMNPSGPLATACHDLETGICKVLRPHRHETIPEMEQIAMGIEYINLFISATIADDSPNEDDFKKIYADLNTAEMQGVMTETQTSQTCLNSHGIL